ncbi:hypothetical protein DL98DRAFT_594468 [Cadophora sp. DSE1049]|nr:hypothetical protein DL98DRAFT_594468 [Cadophora sp. DSE1049]
MAVEKGAGVIIINVGPGKRKGCGGISALNQRTPSPTSSRWKTLDVNSSWAVASFSRSMPTSSVIATKRSSKVCRISASQANDEPQARIQTREMLSMAARLKVRGSRCSTASDVVPSSPAEIGMSEKELKVQTLCEMLSLFTASKFERQRIK